MAPTTQWVFFATAVDASIGRNCGVRYYISGTSTVFYKHACRDDEFYSLTDSDTILNVGGIADSRYPASERPIFATAYGRLQYVRLCLDYVPTTQDEFLDLATMESASKTIEIRMPNNFN